MNMVEHTIDRFGYIVPGKLEWDKALREPRIVPDYDTVPMKFFACTCGSDDDIIWPTYRAPNPLRELIQNGVRVTGKLKAVIMQDLAERIELRKRQARERAEIVKRIQREFGNVQGQFDDEVI